MSHGTRRDFSCDVSATADAAAIRFRAVPGGDDAMLTLSALIERLAAAVARSAPSRTTSPPTPFVRTTAKRRYDQIMRRARLH